MPDSLDTDLIPYACHIDDFTVLTKNDMLVQTVTFSTNLDDHNSFRDSIRLFILNHYSQNIAIYFHTIKLSGSTKVKSFDSLPRFEHVIGNKITEISQFTSLVEVSFNVTFVTSVLDKNRSELMLTFTPQVFYSRHEKATKRAVKRLDKITNRLIEEFSDYVPTKLGIVARDGGYESQHMNFLGKIINFTDYKYELPIGSLCYSTLNSEYKFGKNIYRVRGDDGDKYIKIFTLKGYSEVPVDVVYQIVEKVPNIIISQAAIPINNKQLIKEYAQIAEIYRASTDEEFKHSSALEYMNKLLDSKGLEDIYAKSQINVTVFAESSEMVSKNASIIADIFAKTGIVAFTEDVHLQNATFGTIPSNFRFLARLSNVPIGLLGGFAYAQGSDEIENSDFMWDKTLLTLQKINKKRYELGLHREQRNIFITGKTGSGTGVLTSLLSLGAVKNDINTLFIDIDGRFDAGLWLAGVAISNITSENVESESYIKINPFSGLGAKMKDVEYVKNIIKMMAGKRAKELEGKLGYIVDQVIATNGGAFDSVISEYKLTEIFQDWLTTGKYGKIFNYSLTEDAFSIGKNLKINITESATNDPKLLQVINFIILFKIINLLFSGKKMLISFNCVFKYLKTNLEAKILEQIFTKARNQETISFVFSNPTDLDLIENNPVARVILAQCEQKIFFSHPKDSSDERFAKVFNLKQSEVSELNVLYDNHGRSFMTKTPYDEQSIRFNLSKLAENLLILSDGDGKAMKLISQISKSKSDRRDVYKELLSQINDPGIIKTNDEIESKELSEDEKEKIE